MRYGLGVLVLALVGGQAWGRGTAPVSGGCPVNFSAQRRSPVELTWAEDGSWKNHGHWIQLSMGRGAEKIVKMDVTLHGFSPDVRVMPVARRDDDVTEIFQLARGADGKLRTEIQTQKIGTVRWVDLTAIEFANGSAWRASGERRCRVAPDLLMLVAEGGSR